MSFNLYPYTDFHELNLDWIIRKNKELGQAFNDFEAVNKITNAGAWDITKQYQAWTIVSDNNIGYISLKPVPAGVAITNTEYWELVADYSILITDLSSRIGILENEMNVVKPDTAAALKYSKIAYNQKILLIGDSYCEVPGIPYSDQLVSRYGSDRITVLSAPGYGFTNGTWLDLLRTNIGNIPDKDKYSVVVFAGGCNDVSATYAAIQTAIESTIAYVKSNFVNAKVCLACIGGSAPSDQNDSGYYLQENVKRAYNNTTGSWSYINNSECVMLNASYFSADGVHPNQAGSDALFRFFVNWITNYSTEVTSPETLITLTPDSPISSYTSFFMKVRQLNQLFVGKIGRPVFTCSSSDWVENALYHVGSQDNLILKTGREIEITSFGYLKNSTKMYPAHIEITMRCNDVWFRFHLLNKSSTSWETLSGVTEIGLFPHEFITSGQF